MNGSDVFTRVSKPLTRAQERNVLEYLDAQFLELTRNFKKRSEPSSSLRTLPEYLEASSTILSFILRIPPVDPSSGLRVAYLLHLTGDVLGAIPGYKLVGRETIQETLRELLDFLDDLDQAWITVLRCEEWDPEHGEGRTPNIQPAANGSTPKCSPPSRTDLARLRSLLFASSSTIEEWLSEEKNLPRASANPSGPSEEAEDLSLMLARMGLLDQFDMLFTRTLDHLGAFSESAINEAKEMVME